MLHDKIVFVIGTKTYTVSKSDPRWDTVCALASARNYEEVAKMLSTSRATYIINSVNSILKEDNVDNFKFEECAPGTDKAVSWNGRHIRVSYKGVVLPEILQKRMFQCLEKEGKEVVKAWPKLIENILANPDEHCRNAVYEFLENRELPLVLEDGTFIAYKGVRNDFWSEHGNSSTRVISGQVDSEGRILNSIGSVIEVVREDVDTNCNNHCSCGLHVGAKAYATSFAPLTLLVKVNPKDVVTVPTDTAEKCRVSRYEVVGVWEGDEIPGTAVSVTGNGVQRCATTSSSLARFRSEALAVINDLRYDISDELASNVVQLKPVEFSDLLGNMPAGWDAEALSDCGLVVPGYNDWDADELPREVGATLEHPEKEQWWVEALDAYHDDVPVDFNMILLAAKLRDKLVANASTMDNILSVVLNEVPGNYFNEDRDSLCAQLTGVLLGAGFTVTESFAGCSASELIVKA